MAKITPEGLGMWIESLRDCEDGDMHRILDKCKSSGIKWICIKSGEARMYPGFDNAISVMIDMFHANGIKVYTWNHSKPSSWKLEIEQIKHLKDIGVDGHVLGAELEWQVVTENDLEASNFLDALRDAVGDLFIGYSVFAVTYYHAGFPYAAFGVYCDAVMPRVFWTEFNWTVEKAVALTDKSWAKNLKTFEFAWCPVYPVGVTYGKPYSDTKGVYHPDDIVKFLSYYKDVPASLFSFDAASKAFPQTFEVLESYYNGVHPEPTPIPVPEPEPEPKPTPRPCPPKRTFLDVLRAILMLLFHIEKQ